MNKEELNKIKEELENIKSKNNNKIDICDERNRMAKANSLEYKIGTTLVFSMIAYLILIIIASITKLTAPSIITNFFPGVSYPIILTVSSLGIGSIGNICMHKKFRVKERLKKFSNAKNEIELLEEEIYYQIEKEKLNNKNKVIDETLEILNKNQRVLEEISKKYEIKDKTAPQSKEEVIEKSKEISTKITKQKRELDILTTQKVLHDRFWNIRQKLQKRISLCTNSMISGMFLMIFTVIQAKFFTDIIPLTMIFGSFAVGAAANYLHETKRNSNYKKVFDILNKQLEENALKENLKDTLEEQTQIQELIEKQIKKISLLEVESKENQRYLDTHINEENIDDIKPEHFISKLTIQSTPTINFKGAINKNEMSDIVEEIPKVKTLKR